MTNEEHEQKTKEAWLKLLELIPQLVPIVEVLLGPKPSKPPPVAEYQLMFYPFENERDITTWNFKNVGWTIAQMEHFPDGVRVLWSRRVEADINIRFDREADPTALEGEAEEG